MSKNEDGEECRCWGTIRWELYLRGMRTRAPLSSATERRSERKGGGKGGFERGGRQRKQRHLTEELRDWPAWAVDSRRQRSWQRARRRGARPLPARQREEGDEADKPALRRSDSARARDRAERNRGGPLDQDPTVDVVRAISIQVETVHNRDR